MKIRNKEDATKNSLDMTSMIDIVFLLLIFFVMTFKIVEMEGDFSVKMPLASTSNSVVDPTDLSLKLRLRANAEGKLTDMSLNEINLGTDFVKLQNKVIELIGSMAPVDAEEGPELEIDTDYNLRYEYVIESITNVSGYKDGDQVVKLIEKIKFAKTTAMILLLDNYDSFVHNLARYFRIAGCETRVLRSNEVSADDCAAMRPSAIVISPGPKRPEDAGCSVDVIRSISSETPLLGVCLGHQAIAVAFGGLVTQCEPMHGMSSSITHDGGGLFEGCTSPMQVGRYHSLAIDDATLPDELLVTARGEAGMIMAVRHREKPIYGVQFHPESVLTPLGQQVIRNFVRLVLDRVPCQ